VDPSGVALDLDRLDNISDRVLVVQALPDLTVPSLSLSSAKPMRGAPLSVLARIANSGIAPARDVLVEVFDGMPGSGTLLAATTLVDVEPLANVAISIPVGTSNLALGPHRFYVVVDRLEKILEVSDLNNEASVDAIVDPLDVTPPTSSVLPLPPAVSSPQFTVSWSGKDNPGGSGIAYYDVYDSIDGGGFVRWLTQTTETSATFTGALGHTYAFFSVATDHAGLVQPTPAAQAVTKVLTPIPPPPVTATQIQPIADKQHRLTQILITFSDALDAHSAGQVSRYRLAMAGKKGSFTAKDAKLIPLRSAAYNAARNTVTLVLKHPLKLTKAVQLLIHGQPPLGLRDSRNRLIDGDRDGQPGGDALAVLHQAGPKIVALAALGRASTPLVGSVVDLVLEQGALTVPGNDTSDGHRASRGIRDRETGKQPGTKFSWHRQT
jgi:hypothetical protein